MPDKVEAITNPSQLPHPFTDMLCAPSLQVLMIVAQRRSVGVGVVYHLQNSTNEMWYVEDAK